MKKIVNISTAFLFFIGILFAGCEKFLDKQPISQLSRELFWKTPKDADIWIAGMYDAMQKTLGNNFYLWGEVRADNEQLCGTGTGQLNFLSNTLNSSMGEVNWSNLYRTISSANFAIKYIPAIPGVAAPQIASQLAQAYAMRALMYFYSIRVWGPVPLITEPYEGADGQQKFFERSPVDIVKAQILSDIDNALKNFDGTMPSIFKFNTASTLALQTDVTMWFKDYPGAISASDKLIALNKYSLVSNQADWKRMFTDPATSTEAILNLYWDYLQDGGGNGVATFYGSGSNTNQYKLRQPLWDTLVARTTDARWWNMTDTLELYWIGAKAKVTYESYNLVSNNMKSCKFSVWDPAKVNTTYKYLGGYIYPNNIECQVYIPIYRYSDIMLLRAEALNKVGRATEAMDIVNTIRKRNGYMKTVTAINTTTTSKLEDAILLERQLELWGEGKRWFDLVRTDKVTLYMDQILKDRGISTGFGDVRRILFPIHSSVFEANPLIKQNDPYTQN